MKHLLSETILHFDTSKCARFVSLRNMNSKQFWFCKKRNIIESFGIRLGNGAILENENLELFNKIKE